MAEATPHTWTCPSCGRRVPLRVDTCHCGMTRAHAEQARSERPVGASARPVAHGVSDGRAALNAMTTDVKLLLAVTALVLITGVVWLAFGPSPEPYPAVLGYMDAGPPKSKPLKAPAQPPFKLPWWK